jgi:hypothetical protein
MSLDLLERARALINNAAPLAAGLALAPLGAQAQVSTPPELVVNYQGNYFYNASGYYDPTPHYTDFKTGQSKPLSLKPVGMTVAIPKETGAVLVKAGAAVDTVRSMRLNYPPRGLRYYYDAGFVALAGGTVAGPLAVGDKLRVKYDVNVQVSVPPETGWVQGSYKLALVLGTSDPGNGIDFSTVLAEGHFNDAGTYTLTGVATTPGLQDWEIGQETYHWRLALITDGTTDLGAWNPDRGQYVQIAPSLALHTVGGVKVSFLPASLARR